MSTHHKAIAVEQLLPDEAVDMTVNKTHWLVLVRLYSAVKAVFGDTAEVLAGIFLRVGGDTINTGEQVSPDLLVAPGAYGVRRQDGVPGTGKPRPRSDRRNPLGRQLLR